MKNKLDEFKGFRVNIAIMRKVIQNSSIISVAPMIDWTDRHCRYFHRLLSPHATLYSEMISTGAILQGNAHKFLEFSGEEHPVVLQLGGNNPKDLAASAKIGMDYGYDEINLNCGCPSSRVKQGRFGACLMNEPDLVADCIAEMMNAVKIPVTVKCRIGIDNSDDYNFLKTFVEKVSATGCNTFIIHARKAWLKGLSPKENREIPPLRYDIAAKIKNDHSNLTIILNGGIKTIETIKESMNTFDGVMIGREAYNNPYKLAEWENELYGTPLPDRFAIARMMVPYIIKQQEINDITIHAVTRHMLDLFNGMRGARLWRQKLSTDVHNETNADKLIEDALKFIE